MCESCSAAIVVKDGSLTIDKSILSIIDLVSEAIVVDNGSSDSTLSILYRLSVQNPKIRVVDGRGWNMAECRNYCIENANSAYILKWDADFVALRRHLGAISEFGSLLKEAIRAMNGSGRNICLLKAVNIGPGFDCVGSPKRYAGLGGDIRLYARADFGYRVGRYADEFFSVSTARRLYRNRESSPAGILHLDLLKAPLNIGLRNLRFDYHKIAGREAGGGRSFLQYVKSRLGAKSVENHVLQQIRTKASGYCKCDDFVYLRASSFYRELEERSVIRYSFDDDGRVDDIELGEDVVLDEF